jgi:hypothetical protein
LTSRMREVAGTTLRPVVSAYPSGGRMLQIMWRHGAANWHTNLSECEATSCKHELGSARNWLWSRSFAIDLFFGFNRRIASLVIVCTSWIRGCRGGVDAEVVGADLAYQGVQL